ncbi:MAG: InlB B-repeat-containing protein [Bacteroidales bacterium]|nr:InlB B-repeat-containing protein [Bacteroidales bacterium]
MKNSILGKARWLREVALATSKNNGARVAREWLKYAAMFVMLFTIGVGNVWGEEIKVDSNPKTSGTYTITCAKGNGSSAPADQGNFIRCYANNTITISTTGSNMTQIVIAWTKSNKTFASVTANIGSYSHPNGAGNGTWTGNAQSVTFTVGSSGQIQITQVTITSGGGGGGDCSECTYYVYNGSTWQSIGTTGFDDVVLAPPTVPGNDHGAGNGMWCTNKNKFSSCISYVNSNDGDYRFVPNPGGAEPDAENKPGNGTCELYAVYWDGGCLSTTVKAAICARIWEKPKPNTPSVSGSDVTLSWSPVTGASGYHLYVTDGYSDVFNGDVNSTNKTLTGLAGGSYIWTVAANSSDGDACDSNPADGKVFEIVGCTDISGSTVSSANISITPAKTTATISWSAVANASSYEVKVYAGATASGVAVWTASPAPTSTSCTATGLTANTQYTVAIKAKNACSTSSTAGTKTFETQNLTLYHIDFVNQNNTSSHPAQLEQTSEGQNLDIPANSGGNVTAPSAACSSANWTFAGWKVGSAQEETTSAPSLVAAGTTGYAMDGNKTFYAVFTKTEGGGGGVKTTLLSSTCADAENFTDEDWPTKDTYNLTDPAGALRLGTSKATGSITSKSLSAAVGTTIKVDFEARAYNLKDNGNINVTVSGCDQQSVLWKTYGGSTSEYTSCSLSFVTTTPSFTVTIATSAKRAVLKNIEIYYGGGGGGTTYWNSNPSCSNEATVTYHNDGAMSGDAPTDANSPYTIGDQVTVLGTGTMVAPDGKEFKCWNTAPDGKGTDYNIDAKFEIAANMDFYPKWVNAPYTVRFDAEDGTCGTTSLTEASGGAGVILPAATATCAPAGWSFYGWATSTVSSTTIAPATFVGATGETYYPESDITLHAVYVNSGTYNSNPVCHEVTIGSHTNGTINVNSSTTSPQTVTQGATVNIAATPESGYRFTGWTIKKTTGGNDVTSTLLGANATTASTSFTMPDYDVTVEAVFVEIINYTITWKVNNANYTTYTGPGTLSTSAEGGVKWSTLTLPDAPADNTLSACERTKFVGWSISQLTGDGHSAPSDLFKTTSDANADSHTITGNTTFYAVFAKGGGDGSWVVNGGNLDQTDPQNASTYGKYDGEHTLDGITFNTSDVCTNNGNLQFKASAGTLYNKTAMPADITSIVLSVNTLKVYQNSSVTSSPGALAAITPTGTGPYTYTFTSGNRYFLIKEPDKGASYSTVTVNYEGTGTDYVTSCACSWQINYITNGKKNGDGSATWSTDNCFQKVGDTHEWQIENFAMPDVAGQFWVGPGYFKAPGDWGHSVIADLSTVKYVRRSDKVRTDYSAVSNMIGTLNVWENGEDDNYHVGIYPDYQITYGVEGGGESWTKVDFNYISGTTYETEVVTAPTYFAVEKFKYYVGVKTDGNTGWGGKSSTVMMNTMSGMTTNQNGKNGKWRMYEDSGDANWYCAWVPYYVLSYDANDGTGAPSAEAPVSSEGDAASRTKVVSSTVPTRDGYTFVGWNTAANGSGTAKAAGDNVVLTSDVVLYAQWRQNFTVTYDLNDGTADPACLGGTYYVGQSVTVCSTTPTKTSSSFLGWKRLDTDATVAGGSTFTMPSNNVTLRAQWETVYFHIYYKEEDGTAIATDDVPQTAETTLRNQTPCVGYTFFGWSTSKITSETTTKPSIIGKGGASYTPDADITVYPVYARVEGTSDKNDVITYMINGGAGSYTAFSNVSYTSNAKYAGCTTKTSTDLQFNASNGIVTTTSGGRIKHVQVVFATGCTQPRSLYVYGKNSAYSTFEQNGFPTGASVGTKIATATKTTAINTGEVTIELPGVDEDFEDEYNYIALGADNSLRLTSVKITWSTGTTYYATHCDTKENVTVTYNGNGGTVGCGSPADGAITSVTWDYKNSGADAPILASEQTICASATRSGGYVLRDWTTGVDGTGTHYTPGASITSLANDITLYAQWDRVYTVTFNDQGAITPVTQTSGGATIAVPSNPTPCNTKPGVTWTFVGWGSQDGLVQSLNGHIVITAGTSTYTPSDDITLYAVYRKSTGTSDAFALGTSGAYTIGAKQGAGYAECLATVKSGTGYNCKNDGSEPATIFYLNYINSGEHIGQYTMQDGNTGEYVCYSGNSTGLSWSSTTPYYYNVVANGTGWNLQFSTATGRYFTHETGSTAYSFKAYQSTNPVTLHPAAASTYYTVASCDDDFNITFVANGSEITWQVNHGEGTYYHLADGTEISVFPTASFDGWTFLGWRTAGYDESTTAPEASTIYGGSDGTSGNHYVIHSSITMYPVFTRFEDNEPFDQINGGDYYIYFLESGSNDGYDGEKRVYAASYDGALRYNSSALCSEATTFTFTKLDNGNWTIYDNTTKKYLYGIENDGLKQQASATGAEWTLTVNGNQFDAFHVGTSYGQITAFGNGTSATFMNYRRTNIGSIASYHRVYLGSCTNRTFTTNPSTTPNIELHGQVKVTSTAGKSIKSTSVLTVSASNIATANLTVTSDNSAFKFSLTSNGAYTASVNIPVVSNKVGVTPIYVEYTPTEITNGIEEATITVSDGDVTPTEVSTESGDVQGRHVPANFVIAAKWGDKWYALPANCTESTSSTTGVLIEVDNASDPTRATAAPSYTKWGLQTVRPSRKADYGSRLVFTEQLTTTATADEQKTLYNGSTTSIQANAMYKNYLGDVPDKYEWIPTTTDLKDYILTSATTLSGDASARTVSLSNKGVFGTLLINKSNDGKVRILPADFYEPVEMQVIEWKANSLVVMYGGAGIKATTQVGNNDPSSLQPLASAKVDHGVYELSTSQALTNSTNMPLTITVKNGSDVTTGTCALIVPAIVTGNQDAPLGLTADEATLTDVVVTDGATLSAAATKYTFKNITVYPGGKLVIGSGKQMGMNSLTLRGGSAWGAATYEHKYPQFVVNNATSGAYTNSVAVINYDYVTTKDQYYSFVLPYASNTKNIKYPLDIYGSAVSASNTGSFEFQYYDGEARAAGGTGWKVLEEPATLVAGTGYTFLGMPKKIYAYDGTETRTNVRQRYGIHRIPMSVAAATVQAGETNSAPGKATPIRVTLASKNNNSGWALVGNPYLSNVSGLSNQDIQVGKLVHTDTNPWDGKWQWDDTNSNTGVRYIVTTDDGQTFESQQASTATLKAFKNFFVQIQNGEATSLVIPANSRTDKNLAPARYMADVEQDIQLAVDLVSETRSDKVDLLINDIYTAEFDQDGDFTKMMNTTKFNLYGVYPGDNLSFIAVDKTTAAGSIAIGYQVPAAGEYTLQLSERPYVMSDYVETLLVTDHEVSPEVTTDLLENPYSFTVTKAETNDARFTVSIKLKENQDTPTDIDIINGGGDLDGEKPIKFIYHDKMYILRNGVLYDATGKKVK